MHRKPTIGFISTWPVYQGTTIDRYAHSLIQGISAAANELGCNLLLGCGFSVTGNSPQNRSFWPVPGLNVNFVPVGPWNTDGKHFKCTLWSDIIHLKNAQAIATFEQDYYAGNPAITHNTFGKGAAFYVGTAPDAPGMDWVIEHLCKTSGIKAVSPNMPAGVELLRRANGNASWLFVLNHSGETVKIPLEKNGRDLLTGSQVKGSISLEPTDVAIIQFNTSN